MYKISNFVYCSSVERPHTGNGKRDIVNALGVVSVLMPEFMPSSFSFSIVFSLLDFKSTEKNVIRITFSQKDAPAVLVDTGEITIAPDSEQNEPELPDEWKGINMSMDFRNVTFEKEGTYVTKIWFNGEMLAEKPIYVKGRR